MRMGRFSTALLAGVALPERARSRRLGSKSLKAGDELKMKIDPLRSGAPGGAWSEKKTSFKNGDPQARGQPLT